MSNGGFFFSFLLGNARGFLERNKMLLKKKLRLSYWSAAARSRFVEIYCTSLESHFLPLFLGGGSDLDVQFPTRLSFFEVSVHVKEWEIVAVLEVVLLFMFRIFCKSTSLISKTSCYGYSRLISICFSYTFLNWILDEINYLSKRNIPGARFS